jgi:uncharacterized protein YecE (DUF72 family)
MTIGSLSCMLPGSRPPGRLARYAAAFPTAELNTSFYRWPPAIGVPPLAAEIARWLPPVRQGATGLTHKRRLDAPETWMQHIGAGGHERGGRRAVLLA